MHPNAEYILNRYHIAAGSPSPVLLDDTRDGGLTKIFSELQFKEGTEIGVLSGRFSERICMDNPGVHLFLVDAWLVYAEYPSYTKQKKLDQCLDEVLWRTEKYDCTIVQDYSQEALKTFQDCSLDFVYIDANHDFDFVMEDIIEWSKKVRPGGIVSGHDYSHEDFMDVVLAVNAYVTAHGLSPLFIFSRDKLPSFPSWMWVKP